MKTLSNFKKLIALGMSLSIAGATLFGASAISLKDYPEPFIIDGVPSENLVLIVGDKAAASDVVGMGDIITGLQASAVTQKEIFDGVGDATLEEDGTTIGTTANLLEVNETFGSVKDLFSEGELNILKGGTVATKSGITKYNQYLKFNFSNNYQSLKVFLTTDNFLDVGDFLFVRGRDTLFDWELNFEEGFTSTVSATNSSLAKLDNLEEKKINILGQEYTVITTELDTTQKADSAGHDLKIEFLGGGLTGRLIQGEEETFYLGDKAYKIKVITISETDKKALFEINGKQLSAMSVGQIETTDDGLLFGITSIVATGRESSNSVVSFTLGGAKIVFSDIDVLDSASYQGGTSVNGEIIDQALVSMKGKFLNDKKTEFSLYSINYRLRADSQSDNLFIPPGHGIREYLSEPEGMLSLGWDVKYDGLSDTGVTFIKLQNVESNGQYKLEFTNEEGLNYQVPAFTAQNRTMRPGQGSATRHNMLWTVETSNSLIYPITQGDYFVLSKSDLAQTSASGTKNPGSPLVPDHYGCAVPVRTATKSSGANTRILQYISRNSSNEREALIFNDLATGYKKIYLNSSIGTENAKPSDFAIILGGTGYVGKFNNSAGNLTIDLDGNGTITRGTSGRGGNAWMVTQGGAILFINSSTNFTGALAAAQAKNSPRVATGVSGAAGAAGATTLGNSSCLTITILSNKFDEGVPSASKSHHLNISIPIVKRTGNKVGIDIENYRRANAFTWGMNNITNITMNPTIWKSLDLYGGLWEFYNPKGNESAEKMTYEFPLTQRGPRISIGGQEIELTESDEKISIMTYDKLNKLPTGIAKLSSEVRNIKNYNSIIIGGPCANPLADELMEYPEPCYESIPQREALVKYYEHSNGNVALLVAGRDAEDTRRAARALQSNKIKEAGESREAKVEGTGLNNIIVKAI